MESRDKTFVLWFNDLRRKDVNLVGGKSSSLGELTSGTNVPVPYGFATTAAGYRHFMKETGCNDKDRDSSMQSQNVPLLSSNQVDQHSEYYEQLRHYQ